MGLIHGSSFSYWESHYQGNLSTSKKFSVQAYTSNLKITAVRQGKYGVTSL